MLVNWGRLSVSIENGLHWTLDVTLKNDCRVRTGHAPQKTWPCAIALNTLNREQSFQRSTHKI